MCNLTEMYLVRVVRAVAGDKPATVRVADQTSLTRFCSALVERDEVERLLRRKGYGLPSQSLVELVRALPDLTIRLS